MRRFALKSRLDEGDPDGQGLEMIATLYVRCKAVQISHHCEGERWFYRSEK